MIRNPEQRETGTKYPTIKGKILGIKIKIYVKAA
jgi:hypothetical protein